MPADTANNTATGGPLWRLDRLDVNLEVLRMGGVELKSKARGLDIDDRNGPNRRRADNDVAEI